MYVSMNDTPMLSVSSHWVCSLVSSLNTFLKGSSFCCSPLFSIKSVLLS